MHTHRTLAATAAVAWIPFAAFAAEPAAGDIGDYLMQLGSGPVSAADILGVSGVTTIEAPKDLVLLLNAGGNDGGGAGKGFSITPARTSLFPMSIRDYAEQRNYAARLWGGTSFSYAQNREDVGDLSYRQDAVAVNVSYYLDAGDDPAVAAYRGFAACPALKSSMGDLTDQIMKALAKARETKGSELTPFERSAVVSEQRESTAAQMQQANADAKACAMASVAKAREKWNANQVALTLGQAWVKGLAPGSSRYSLGRVLSLSAAFGPSKQTLVNLTLRRRTHEVDMASLSSTPVYKGTTRAAARLTYGHGDSRDLYAVAEVSNAKDTLGRMALTLAATHDRT